MRTIKDTIIIIGNGFDIWQKLDTSYSSFQMYYLAHRDEILRKLRIPKRKLRYSDGTTKAISDVELVYGDPFHPGELEDGFWGTFEASLDKVDDQLLNYFFGKERSGLRRMSRSIRNAKRILTKAFCDWVGTIKVEPQPPKYRFGENCVVINFNYTDTVQKRFALPEGAEYHIHGEASDRRSIVFGHSSHPELPMEELYRFGRRFRGLYFVEQLLYETDKHAEDCIQELIMFLALQGVMKEEIKHIYVLGQSMGPADLAYFKFLIDATKVQPEDEQEDEFPEDEDIDPLEDFALRMEYATGHRERTFGGEPVDERAAAAVGRRFAAEQDERSQAMQDEFMKLLTKAAQKHGEPEQHSAPAPRTEDAQWHISCFSPKDKTWVETVMREFGCTNYVTHKTIDECLEGFEI